MSNSYKESGVDYDAMDPFKRNAQLLARATSQNVKGLGVEFLTWTRGESVQVQQVEDYFIGHVEEGLGTKNLLADSMRQALTDRGLPGRTYYDHVAKDTVAMIVNDMITLGVRPVSIAMHVAAGASSWFEDEVRSRDLLVGWRDACRESRAVWSGGETPTLKDVINPDAVVLSGSAWGLSWRARGLFDPGRIEAGDKIVFLTSNGIHANGLTLARKIVSNLPQKELTELPDGTYIGHALLKPTHIYVGAIKDFLDDGIDIHYGVNITGHGWRKLMRANQAFSYVIDTLPPFQPEFEFLQQHGEIGLSEMYGTFNMGAGFALYVPESEIPKMEEALKQKEYPYDMIVAGTVEQSTEKRVTIQPLGLKYTAESLQVR